ncbi:DExH-box ATP-dependent RNA helicase DExH12, partial [Tanacetum coccineum]
MMIIKYLLRNRLKIVWCTHLARAEDQEKRKQIEEEMTGIMMNCKTAHKPPGIASGPEVHDEKDNTREEGASDADINILPKYIYAVSNDEEQPDVILSRMVPMGTNDPDFERFLLTNDA